MLRLTLISHVCCLKNFKEVARNVARKVAKKVVKKVAKKGVKKVAKKVTRKVAKFKVLANKVAKIKKLRMSSLSHRIYAMITLKSVWYSDAKAICNFRGVKITPVVE